MRSGQLTCYRNAIKFLGWIGQIWKMHPSKVPFGEHMMLVSWRLPIPVNCESETLILDRSRVKITWDSWILVTLK